MKYEEFLTFRHFFVLPSRQIVGKNAICENWHIRVIVLFVGLYAATKVGKATVSVLWAILQISLTCQTFWFCAGRFERL
jgi:hypothetical protein